MVAAELPAQRVHEGKLALPARTVFAQPNGELIVTGNKGAQTLLWKVRPPDDVVQDSTAKFKGKIDRLGCPACGSNVSYLPGLTTHENLRLAWSGDTDETEQEAVEREVPAHHALWF